MPERSECCCEGFGEAGAMSRAFRVAALELFRSSAARRRLMTWTILAAAVLVFAGGTFLGGWIESRPLVFLGFWAVCALLTFFSMLLAVYDILMVRRAGIAARRDLGRKILGGRTGRGEDRSDEAGEESDEKKR